MNALFERLLEIYASPVLATMEATNTFDWYWPDFLALYSGMPWVTGPIANLVNIVDKAYSIQDTMSMYGDTVVYQTMYLANRDVYATLSTISNAHIATIASQVVASGIEVPMADLMSAYEYCRDL